ncbi:MAG TPA: phosphoribosylformylglycinamidine cyclo-ligase [Fimbriimonadaceae bacterium]|jgi:phosphoribosylformylglycinamidine cyclo-ligase
MLQDPLTYQAAGVNIDEAQRALRSVSAEIQSTYTEGVVSGVGGFGGVFKGTFEGYERPLLVSSIDGVGTKTKVAAMVGSFKGLGEDIVNHCVNDVLCQGAKPLFFMDYFGTSNLSATVFEEVLQGVAEACRLAGCALLGGETAEMPDVYHDEEVDIVGSIVGVVDADRKLPRGKMQPNDLIIGLASNGLHTNGYSLARKALFEMGGLSVRDEMPGLGTTIGEELLRPHKSYLPFVYPLIQETDAIHAVAHVTGGGFFDNLPRVMPSDVQAVIERRAWTPLPIFQLIQQTGNIPDSEMFRAFNMGIGMVLFVQREAAAAIVQRLQQYGEAAAVIGTVVPGPHDVQLI